MGRTQIVVRFADMASVRGDDAWSLQEGCCGYDSAENGCQMSRDGDC